MKIQFILLLFFSCIIFTACSDEGAIVSAVIHGTTETYTFYEDIEHENHSVYSIILNATIPKDRIIRTAEIYFIAENGTIYTPLFTFADPLKRQLEGVYNTSTTKILELRFPNETKFIQGDITINITTNKRDFSGDFVSFTQNIQYNPETLPVNNLDKFYKNDKEAWTQK